MFLSVPVFIFLPLVLLLISFLPEIKAVRAGRRRSAGLSLRERVRKEN